MSFSSHLSPSSLDQQPETAHPSFTELSSQLQKSLSELLRYCESVQAEAHPPQASGSAGPAGTADSSGASSPCCSVEEKPAACDEGPACAQARPNLPAATPKAQGELRTYYFAPAVLNHERKILKKHRARDFPELLDKSHKLLAGLVKIMKRAHPDAKLKGTDLSSLGCLLEQVSALLLSMRNVYEKLERVS